ncbi:MAG: hypothetical protein AAGI52_09650 [Bacteroidota bacterium]
MESAIYTAGLLDGEGTITLHRARAQQRFRYPLVEMTSTSRELIDFMQETWGGAVVKHKVYKAHHRQSWSWRVIGNAALDLIQRTLPYLKEREKVRRGRLLLDHYKRLTPRNGRYSPSMIEAKDRFERAFFHPEADMGAEAPVAAS